MRPARPQRRRQDDGRRILATLLRADGGRATSAGIDVRTRPREVRERIGLTSQHDAIDEALTARQNLELFARLHHLDPRAARRRADELLERFGLVEAADRRAQGFSVACAAGSTWPPASSRGRPG